MQAENIVTNNLAVLHGLGGLKGGLEDPAALTAKHCK
jgi:hypothetical protein